MTAIGISEVPRLLAAARRGDGAVFGALLELYRDYLHGQAMVLMGRNLRAAANPSDLVQHTFLEVCSDFARFEGTTEAQWRAWLRRVLAHNLATLAERHLQARKRDIRRQISLDRGPTASGGRAGCLEPAASPSNSPSAPARRLEASAVLAERLAELPAAYREVLVWRNFEGLSFEKVARRMGRTPGAVRVLWVRALDQLRLLLKEDDLI